MGEYREFPADRTKWADYFEECFTNPTTDIPYPVPADVRAASERIIGAYGIRGVCDPMYVANVIATELGIGDGGSTFDSFRITIGTRHAAFTPEDRGAEIARILRRIADSCEIGNYGPSDEEYRILDANGNTCGAVWHTTDDDEADQ